MKFNGILGYSTINLKFFVYFLEFIGIYEKYYWYNTFFKCDFVLKISNILKNIIS